MKRLNFILGILAVCAMSLLFTACPGGPDEPEPTPNPPIPTPSESETDNLTNYVGFDFISSAYSDDANTHLIILNFGVSAGHYTAGISKFGVAVKAKNGTIKASNNNVGFSILNKTVHGQSMKVFVGTIYDDKSDDWESVFSVISSDRNVELEFYRCYFNEKKGEWTYAEKAETYTHIANENDNSDDNAQNDKEGVSKGSGTQNDPYNVSGIIKLASRLKRGEIDATDYYFKGIISKRTYQFGEKDTTATFYISDRDGTSEFLCKQVCYLHNDYSSVVGLRGVAVGDEVVICGKITKDYDDVVGTSSKRARLYSLNNYTGTTEAIKYSIGDRTFRTILVEGGAMGPFYIMQTEVPINADITINGRVVTPLDVNGNSYIINTELRAFLLEIRQASGCPFRLPTKDEWQYAASGGNKSKDYTYSGGNYIDDVAWYSKNSDNKVHEIARKQPNELDLYDMSGNYAEICFNPNAKGDTSYERGCNVDGPICGGSWKDAASGCTVNSWQEGVVNGRVEGYGSASEKNLINGKYITVRLVYTKR